MGPLVNARSRPLPRWHPQVAGRRKLCVRYGSRRRSTAQPDRSAFVAPTLLRVKDFRTSEAVCHEGEVFRPAATIRAYRDEQGGCQISLRGGGGSLVALLYGDDHGFLGRMGWRDGLIPLTALVVDPAIAAPRRAKEMSCRSAIMVDRARPAREELGGLSGLASTPRVAGGFDRELAPLQARLQIFV